MSPLMQLYAFLILEGYIMYGIIKNKILKKICCLLYTLTIKSELRVQFCRFFYVIAFVLTLVLQSGTNLLQNSTISSNSYSISRSYSSYIPNIYYVIFTTTNTLWEKCGEFVPSIGFISKFILLNATNVTALNLYTC